MSSAKGDILYRRLDYLLISDHLQPLVKNTDIIVAPSTDHSAVVLSFSHLSQESKGPSFWKLNNSLLKDKEYVDLIQSVISKCKCEMMDSTMNPN